MTTNYEELYKKAFENYLHTGNEDGLAELSKKVFDAIADNGYFLPPCAQLAISSHLSKNSILYRLANKVNVNLKTTTVEFNDPRTDEKVATFLGTMLHESRPSKLMIGDFSRSLTRYITLDVSGIWERALNNLFIHGGMRTSDKLRGILDYPPWNEDYPRWSERDQVEQINSGINGKITGNGLFDLQNSLMLSYRENASWLINRKSCRLLKELRSGNGTFLFKQDKPITHILGRPVHICDNMPIASSDSLPIAYGDFNSAYTVFEHPLISIVRNPLDEAPAILFGAIKGITGYVVNGDAIKILKLSI